MGLFLLCEVFSFLSVTPGWNIRRHSLHSWVKLHPHHLLYKSLVCVSLLFICILIRTKITIHKLQHPLILFFKNIFGKFLDVFFLVPLARSTQTTLLFTDWVWLSINICAEKLLSPSYLYSVATLFASIYTTCQV